MILPERLLHEKMHVRQTMVDCQLRPNGIINERLIKAFETVPMEAFVPPSVQPLAYSDADLPLTFDPVYPKRWLLAPLTLAKLFHLANIQPEDNVLMIGCGTGYSLALGVQLAKHIVGLECDEALIHIARMYEYTNDPTGIEIVVGALSVGYPKAAPFNVILIEGAVHTIPPILLQQLAHDGRLVTVLRETTGVDEAGLGRGVLIERKGNSVMKDEKFDVSCPFLPEFEPKGGFTL